MVLLPLPDGPTSANVWPGYTVKVTSFRICFLWFKKNLSHHFAEHFCLKHVDKHKWGGGKGEEGGRGMGRENTFLNWSVTQLWIPPGDQRSPRTNVIQTTFLSYPVLVSQKTNREGKISISYKTFQSHIHTAGLWKSDIINQVKIYVNFHMWLLIPLTHHLQYIFSKHTYCGL